VIGHITASSRGCMTTKTTRAHELFKFAVFRETCCYICMKLSFACVCKSAFMEAFIICLNEIFTCVTPIVLEIINVNIMNVVKLHSVPQCACVLDTVAF
jgi:diacylglycerol kinase